MKRFVAKTLLIGAVCAAIWAAPASQPVTAQSTAQSEDPAVLQNDKAFVEAVGKADKAALGKLLDADFTWTDSAGNTLTRAEVLKNLPTPTAGYDAEAKERTY